MSQAVSDCVFGGWIQFNVLKCLGDTVFGRFIEIGKNLFLKMTVMTVGRCSSHLYNKKMRQTF